MDNTIFTVLKLLGSLALLMYGMKVMSEGLQKLTGDHLRNILGAMTTNRFTGLFTGAFATAALIMGKNIRTTVTYTLSAFHSTFNICNILILTWFIKPIGRLVCLVTKSNPEDEDAFMKSIAYSCNNLARTIKHRNVINNYRNLLKQHNVKDINNKEYRYQDGVHYMDIVSEAEKPGDYVLNVVQAVVEKKI